MTEADIIKYLIEKGYKLFTQKYEWEHHDYFYQKRIRDEEGKTKYFIDFWHYPKEGPEESVWEATVHLSKEHFVVKLRTYVLTFNSEKDLDEIESYIDTIWKEGEHNYYGEDD